MAAGNAESVANEVTGESDTEAQVRVFCDSGLIGNPCVVMMPSPHTGHFACAAFGGCCSCTSGYAQTGQEKLPFHNVCRGREKKQTPYRKNGVCHVKMFRGFWKRRLLETTRRENRDSLIAFERKNDPRCNVCRLRRNVKILQNRVF